MDKKKERDLDLGELIDQKLLERRLTRKEFCDLYEIPLYRVNRMARGLGIHKVDQDRIFRLLGIGEEELNARRRKREMAEKARTSGRTEFGWEVKRKLILLGLTQKRFCEQYDIPTGKLSGIIRGRCIAKKQRQRIAEILQIDEKAFDAEKVYTDME